MTETQSSFGSKEPKQPIPFGMRLKNAREEMGIEPKEVAAQLRLNEQIIHMLEKDRFPADLPPTFIRGYMRAYGKLLQLPESEIKKAVETIKHRPIPQQPLSTFKQSSVEPVTSGNYFMQFFTYLILFTLLGLVGMWWYTHSTATKETNDKAIAELSEPNSSINQPPQASPSSPNPNNLYQNTQVPQGTQKLTTDTNSGIMQNASGLSENSANIEEELQATAEQIEATHDD